MKRLFVSVTTKLSIALGCFAIGSLCQLAAAGLSAAQTLPITTTGAEEITVSGMGKDIWGRADDFQYIDGSATGDFTFVARVITQSNSHPWAKAGLMVRNDSTPGSVNAFLAITPSNGVAFQWRSYGGDITTATSQKNSKVPIWLKLVRTGATVEAFSSVDGVLWSQVGTQTLLLLNATVQVGLAVTSHDATLSSTASFTNLAFTQNSAPLDVVPPQGILSYATDAEVNLGWNTLNIPAGISRYDIYRNGWKVGSTTTNNYSDLELSASTAYIYTIKAIDGNGKSSDFSAPVNVVTSAPYLPLPYFHQDIGAVQSGGSSTFTPSTGQWSVEGAGSDIWNRADSFQYAWQTANGDGEFIARVTTLHDSDSNAKAGLMVRTSLSPDSKYVLLAVTPGRQGIILEDRMAKGANSNSEARTGVSFPGPVWLRLIRSGSVYVASYSTDGSGWIQLGSNLTLDLGDQINVGLAVTSHNANVVTSAQFDNLLLTRQLPSDTRPPSPPSGLKITGGSDTELGLTFQPSTDQVGVTGYNLYRNNVLIDTTLKTEGVDFNLQPGANYSYYVTATNAAGFESAASNTVTASTSPVNVSITPWTQGDVGQVNFVGENLSVFSLNLTSPTSAVNVEGFEMSGSGADIWGRADAFSYIYQPLEGDSVIETQVQSQTAGGIITYPGQSPGQLNSWAKAGVMVRESLDEDAKEVSLLLTPGNGVTFQWRSVAGGPTMKTSIPGVKSPKRVLLERRGDLFTGYISDNGTDWTVVGSQTIPMSGAFVTTGLAVTSHNNAHLSTASFNDLKVSKLPTDFPDNGDFIGEIPPGDAVIYHTGDPGGFTLHPIGSPIMGPPAAGSPDPGSGAGIVISGGFQPPVLIGPPIYIGEPSLGAGGITITGGTELPLTTGQF